MITVCGREFKLLKLVLYTRILKGLPQDRAPLDVSLATIQLCKSNCNRMLEIFGDVPAQEVLQLQGWQWTSTETIGLKKLDEKAFQIIVI